jgi:hypothetical protein
MENSTEIYNNSTSKMLHISRRHKKPPVTKMYDFFFMADDNQILNKLSKDIYSLTVFHQNICGLRSRSDELTSSLFPNLPHLLYLA